jgi:hypothetical protein
VSYFQVYSLWNKDRKMNRKRRFYILHYLKKRNCLHLLADLRVRDIRHFKIFCIIFSGFKVSVSFGHQQQNKKQAVDHQSITVHTCKDLYKNICMHKHITYTHKCCHKYTNMLMLINIHSFTNALAYERYKSCTFC